MQTISSSATVPNFETDIYDLGGLIRLGEKIWS